MQNQHVFLGVKEHNKKKTYFILMHMKKWRKNLQNLKRFSLAEQHC